MQLPTSEDIVKGLLHRRRHGETAPPHGGSKIYEGKLEKEHDEGALPHKKNNSVTEEGVVRPSSEEKGLELFGLGSQAQGGEKEHK